MATKEFSLTSTLEVRFNLVIISCGSSSASDHYVKSSLMKSFH
jgi:hypothetical protein